MKKAQGERRNPAMVDDRTPMSPELVALLVMCGADVRAADRDLVEAADPPDAFERRGPDRRRSDAG